ncbi:MAG: DNA-protecting protein DprA [Clostridia bacterium]|nr:DNA-protecting protein DprA [Clostridia bacterium]
MKIITQKDEGYPKRLLQIQNPPERLYVEGNEKLLNQDAIAIVGTRNYTKYGEKCASKFARELSKKGICIVSGLARGIDSIAHINSMDEEGKTIAVLGSGFDHIYPKENQYLYQKIIENGGCIVTEYPPETPIDKAKFPKRNRIISGLAMGVLVIEARYRSGTSITAKHAISQHKEVFCIPHPLDTPTGYIPNLLIQQGAQLVTSGSDILQYYNEDEKYQTQEIPEEYQQIYNLIGQLPISANNIVKILHLEIAKVTEALFMLELDGFIKQLPGNVYIRNYK